MRQIIRRNPAEALLDQGRFREAVGGPRGGAAAAASFKPIPPVTGVTVPLTVTNVSQELVPADEKRKFIFISNADPIGIVFVSIGGNGAALNQGFRLGAAGGAVLLDINVPTDRIFMIGNIASNVNVSIITG